MYLDIPWHIQAILWFVVGFLIGIPLAGTQLAPLFLRLHLRPRQRGRFIGVCLILVLAGLLAFMRHLLTEISIGEVIIVAADGMTIGALLMIALRLAVWPNETEQRCYSRSTDHYWLYLDLILLPYILTGRTMRTAGRVMVYRPLEQAIWFIRRIFEGLIEALAVIAGLVLGEFSRYVVSGDYWYSLLSTAGHWLDAWYWIVAVVVFQVLARVRIFGEPEGYWHYANLFWSACISWLLASVVVTLVRLYLSL